MKTQLKLNKYLVYVSPHTKFAMWETNPENAKFKVWNEIKDFYTYGWIDWQDFNNNVRVEVAI